MHDIHGGDAAAIAKRLGLRSSQKAILDFSVNLNPLGAPPAVLRALVCHPDLIENYPPGKPEAAEALIAAEHGVSPAGVVLGNGATEIFDLLLRVIAPLRVCWLAPGYSGYAELCAKNGIPAEAIQLAEIPGQRKKPDFDKTVLPGDCDIVFLASPNNPTGTSFSPGEIIKLAEKHPASIIVCDESFIDFVRDAKRRTLIGRDLPGNIVIVKSLTKSFALAGLRLGFAWSENSELAAKIRRLRAPWSVNGLAQAAIGKIYADPEYLPESRRQVKFWRESMIREIRRFRDITPLPSSVNYFLCRLAGKLTASTLQSELLKRGILIRSCADIEGLDETYIRIAVRPPQESNALIAALSDICEIRKSSKTRRQCRKGRALMLVGTSSDAGKSVLCAAFCRWFYRQGISVAPFKAQNMSLNSFVTTEGDEMGRAQVVQAMACGLQAHADMNPVLLKPMGDARSQVILNGKPYRTMSAGRYYREKAHVRKEAKAACDRLLSKYEMLIMEGAGSPAEINLQKDDFVNLFMAVHADASAILVADIDRGGVFASVLGTVRLLPPDQRRCLRGIIINKFRGDVKLLEPGLRELEELIGIPVFGVIPYIHDLRIEEEDGVAIENRAYRPPRLDEIDIAVIRLGRISNYTDFLMLEQCPGVHLRYISRNRDLGHPDLIIIPGTRNTIADLQILRQNGLAKGILEAHHRGVPVFGICGGYQMLGKEILDPDGIEGRKSSSRGLGLLPISTTIKPWKTLSQIVGTALQELPFMPVGTKFSGYEIHAGESKSEQSTPCFQLERKAGKISANFADGTIINDGTSLAFGTYVHGLFDSPAVREALLGWLAECKGIRFHDSSPDLEKMRETEFNRLAKMLDTHLDMKSIMQTISG